MGRIGKNLKAEIDQYIEQCIETRLGYNQSAFTYGPSGDDSPPVKDDRIVLVQVDGTGKFVAAGVLTVSQGAKPGEKILFSRNADGEVQAVLKMLEDGKVELKTPEEIKVENDKRITIKSGADMSLDASSGKMEIKSTETTLTGGMVKCKGTATPSGTGCFCALPTCPVTGAPHSGEMVTGA